MLLAALFGRRLSGAARLRAGWLVVFVLGFGLMTTLGAKKFDRYLLPAVPMLVILASAGWWLLLARARRVGVRAALATGLVALLAYPLISVYPYPLAYYNSLLGGG